MKVIFIIAKNTFKEIIRDRVLYGLILFMLLLLGVSMILGQLSFAEQARISANFGFTAIHLSAVILSIFVGSTLVAKEIDKKTILTLLVRPISRLQFLLGKCLGLLFTIATVILGLALVLGSIIIALELSLNQYFILGLYGVVLEAIVLLGVTIFFSTFCRPVMAVSFSVGVFLIGHWVNNLEFFATRSDNEAFRSLSLAVQMSFPNLEMFNWRSLFIYNDSIPGMEVLAATAYAMCWFSFLISFAVIIIRKKDFA